MNKKLIGLALLLTLSSTLAACDNKPAGDGASPGASPAAAPKKSP